jgi:hypothetical protein
MCAAFSWLVLASGASAQTIGVTSTADGGQGSLRAAIAAAGAGDTIAVPAGNYVLTSGEILITQPITIDGAGAPATVISTTGSSRVFEVTSSVPSAATVSIAGVTITHGAATSEPGGGGILVDSGQLNVINSAITGNTAGTMDAPLLATSDFDGGGGIYNNGGTTRVSGSSISNNTAVVSNGYCCHGGAGIYQNFGDVDLTNSTMSGNRVSALDNVLGNPDDIGGGAIHQAGSSGDVNVSGSLLSGNTTTVDGLGASTGDTCCSGGGGVYNDGNNVTITGSTLAENSASLTGTGGPNGFTVEGGGAIYQHSRATTIIDTTINANIASFGATPPPTASGGGAVTSDTASALDATNSTITANSTNITDGSGATNGGGGIYALGTTNLANVTIAGNNASAAPGGGIYVLGATLSAANSIVALNTAASGGSNCDGAFPTFSSSGYNLEDTPDSCAFTGNGDQVLPSAGIGLGELASNGGPTQTRRLLPGSPAIDGGSPAGCTDPSADLLSFDQRRFSRPAGAHCDIGAYEFSPPTVTSRPAILGMAQAGQRLFCSPGSFGGTPARELDFQWNRDGSPIDGATEQSYVPVAADAGQQLTCTETDQGDGVGQTTSDALTVASIPEPSEPPAPVPPTPSPLTPPSFGAHSLVSLLVSHGVIKLPRGVRSTSITARNKNKFAVTGTLQAKPPPFGVIAKVSGLGPVRRFSLPALRSKKIKLTFGTKLVKRLRTAHRLTVQLALSLADPSGHRIAINGVYLLKSVPSRKHKSSSGGSRAR